MNFKFKFFHVIKKLQKLLKGITIMLSIDNFYKMEEVMGCNCGCDKKFMDVLAQFKPVKLHSDDIPLTEDLKEALPYIKNAMDGITEIFLRQQNEYLPEHYDEIMDSDDEDRKSFYEFFKGPWNQLTDYKSEFDGIDDRPKGCAFYPADIEKEEFETFLETLSKEEKERFTDTYTVVVRDDDGLKAVPFHEYYNVELEYISENLEKAAEIVENEELSSYLKHRAETLLNGEYQHSDSEWVKMKNSPLELVMGPYEVYADAFMGIKATYESMLLVVDREKGDALAEIESNLNKLAEIFPVPEGSKPAVGGMAPMVVVNQIYSAGEAAQGIMASAFNLPNDPWVRGNVGWKQVMIYNVMQAKFNTCTKVIAERVLENGTALFDPYFNFVLLHEVSHGLGPAYRSNGENVAKCIGSAYTAVEEAKADTGALYLLLHLGGKYGIPEYKPEELFESYFAGLFRSMRFGVHEAHGAANVIQFNWFMEKGVITLEHDGRFTLNVAELTKHTDELLNTICDIEANATPEKAQEFLKKYAKPGKEITDTLDKLKDIPIDIRAEYEI